MYLYKYQHIIINHFTSSITTINNISAVHVFEKNPSARVCMQERLRTLVLNRKEKSYVL